MLFFIKTMIIAETLPLNRRNYQKGCCKIRKSMIMALEELSIVMALDNNFVITTLLGSVRKGLQSYDKVCVIYFRSYVEV